MKNYVNSLKVYKVYIFRKNVWTFGKMKYIIRLTSNIRYVKLVSELLILLKSKMFLKFKPFRQRIRNLKTEYGKVTC